MTQINNHWANIRYNAITILDLKRKLEDALLSGNNEKIREIKRKINDCENRRIHSAKELGIYNSDVKLIDADKIIELAHKKEKQCQLNNF